MGEDPRANGAVGSDEEYDLFVSYARADDEAPSGVELGWVTTLVSELQKVLRRKLGGDGARVWMDHQLAANQPVTRTLLQRVRASRALLLVMSPGFCASRWCRDELAQFVAAAEVDGKHQAIFPIEVESVDRAWWPTPLQSLTPISFQVRRPGERAPRLAGYPTPSPKEDSLYWNRLTELAHLVAEHLKRQPSNFPATERHPVVLAEPADDVDHWHGQMLSALRQRPDVLLLPATPYPRRSGTDYEAVAAEDLRRARLHIQLFSLSAGASLPGEGRRVVTLQAELARKSRLDTERLLCWLEPELLPEHAADPMLKLLFEKAGISRLGFEAFRASVLRAIDDLLPPSTTTTVAQAKPAAPLPASVPDRVAAQLAEGPEAASGLAIYVQATPEDLTNAERVADHLQDMGASVHLSPDPRPGQAFIDSLRSQEDALRLCDGVLFLYGHSPTGAVSAAFQYAQRVFGVRRPGIWSAVLDLPPGDKPALSVRSRNLMTIDCRAGFDPQRLNPFYAALRSSEGQQRA